MMETIIPSQVRMRTLFEFRLFPAQACLLESPVLERKSEGKTLELESFLWYYIHAFGSKEWSKGKL